MKRLIFTFILFLPFLVNAQFQWEKLSSHLSEDTKVIHYTQDERMIGYHQYNHKLYYSTDLGATWELLADMQDEGDPFYRFSERIIERSDGTLFTIISDFIYEIDEVNKTVIEFFEPNMFFGPDDFFFLDNGEMIVVNVQDIQKYSSTGSLLVSVELDEGSFDTRILKGEGDTHYSYSSGGLTKFNSSLSEVEEDIVDSYFGSFIDRAILGEDGSIFTKKIFSSDGISWNKYPNEIEGYPILNGEGDLCLLDEGITYITKDNGVSFDQFTNDLGVRTNSPSALGFSYGDTGLIYSQIGCPGELYHSMNGVTNWQDMSESLKIGNAYTFEIEAVHEGSVLAEACRSDFVISQGDDWQPLILESSCLFYSLITSLPDGSLLTNDGCKSTDGGQSWVNTGANLSFGQQELQINSSGIYFLGYNEITYSYDNGETWITNDLEDTVFFAEEGVVSVNEQIYVPDDFTGALIYRYDFEGEVVDAIASLIPNSSFRSMAASFNQGKVFALVDSWNNNPSLMVYDEASKTSVTKSLPVVELSFTDRLICDHGDNLYFFNEEKLFISPDEGDTWEDITPVDPEILELTDIDVSWDGYLYVSTVGTPIFKSKNRVANGHNLLTVILYEDGNSNCDYDSNEKLIEGLRIEIGHLSKPSGANGASSFLLWQGQHEFHVDAREDLFETCEYETLVEYADVDNTDTLYVGVRAFEDCVDLSVSASTPFLRRCFDNIYYVEIYNDGTEVAQNTELNLILDEHFDFINSNMDLIETIDNDYTFLVPDIPPRESFRGQIEFNLSCDAELGQAHYMTAQLVYENACQINTGDSLTFECRENIGSYDPNDKQKGRG